MTFERSSDWELIKRIVTDPSVYPHVGDDGALPAEQWEPSGDKRVWYVICRDGALVLGLWALVPQNSIRWAVHTCLLPCAYGQRARAAVKEAIRWFWAAAPECQRIVTEVPESNRLANRFALVAGMTPYGRDPKSFKKNGQIEDVILLGISRPQGT